jgi:hypothetical protein
MKVDDTNPLIDLLRLAGIARVAEGRLRVRNRIYERVFDREWIAQHMPDAAAPAAGRSAALHGEHEPGAAGLGKR